MADLDLNPDSFEEEIANMEQIDEFSSSVNFEKFIVLSKKDISAFCRVVEPLTKQTIDDYGKSVLVQCIDNDTVQLVYINTPYVVVNKVPNKSGKKIKDFTIAVSILKRLVTQAFASLILVEQNDEINVALCESLLYLETKNLNVAEYAVTQKTTENSIDKELASYVFRKVAASLALTERASEKLVVVKNKTCNFNTGVFAARTKSPFSGDEDFVLYKQVSDIIAVFTELSASDIKYQIHEDIMALSFEGFYAEVQIGGDEKVKEFLSPTADANLAFDATVCLINDNLLRIITIVGTLEYLSEIVTLVFSKDKMSLKIFNVNQTKSSDYDFNIIEGIPEETGEMKVTTPVLKLFLSIVGQDCKYSFTSVGLGIQTPNGKFIIRRA